MSELTPEQRAELFSEGYENTESPDASVSDKPEIPREAWTEETIVNNPQWMADAHTLKDVLGIGVREAPDPVEDYMSTVQNTNSMFKAPVGIDEMQAGMAEAEESFVPPERSELLIDGVELTDESLSKALMDYAGRTQWNTTKMATLAFAEAETWTEEQQVALVRSFATYNEDLPTTWASTVRGLEGVAADPMTYFGVSFIFSSLAKVALKPAAAAMVKQKLATITGVTAVSAAEGGLVTAAHDVSMQKLDITAGIAEDYDYVRTGVATGMGMGTGGFLGWGISSLLSRWGARRAGQASAEGQPNAPVADEALPPVVDEALPPVVDEALPTVVDEALPARGLPEVSVVPTEGRFNDIVSEGEKIGSFELYQGDEFISVGNPDVDTKGKGFGQATYIAVAEKFPDKQIRSGDMSEEAAAMWERMHKDGRASKTDVDGHVEYTLNKGGVKHKTETPDAPAPESVWYHGSNSDIKEWKVGTSGRNKDSGIWVTSSPELGSKYAERWSSDQAVYPLRTGASENSIQLDYDGVYRHYAIPEDAVLKFPDGSTKTLAEAMPLTKKQKETGVTTTDVARFFRESGEFDGINFKDILDNADKTDITSDVMSIFKPEKLKGLYNKPDAPAPAKKVDETPPHDIGPDHVRVNVNRMVTSKDVKAAVISHADEHGGQHVSRSVEEAMRRGRIEAQKLVESTGGDLDEVLSTFEGDLAQLDIITDRMTSSRILHVTMFEDMISLKDKALDGANLGDMTAAEMQQFLRLTDLAPRMSGIYVGGSVASSRLLGQRRGMVKANKSLVDPEAEPIQRFLPEFDPSLRDNIDTAEARAAIKTIALALQKAIDDGHLKMPKDMEPVLARGLKDKIMDGLISVQTASMVGGPSTIKLAATAGFVNLWYQPALQFIGASVPVINRGVWTKAEKKTNSDLRYHAVAQYIGNVYYAKDSTLNALRSLKSGLHITDPHVTQIENVKQTKSNSQKSKAEFAYDHTWAAAHTALMMIDEYTKNNTAKSMAMADGFVAARAAGHKVGTKAWRETVSKSVDNAFDMFGALKGKDKPHILTEMRERTYTTSLKGDRGKFLNAVAHSKGTKLGQLLFMPFKRAPVNTVAEGLMMIPGTGLSIPFLPTNPALSAKQRWIKEEGDPIQLAKLKARKIVGAGMIVSLWALLDEDEDFCVGSGPIDWDANKEWQDIDGRLPYSCKNPETGEWVSYKKAEPFATVMGLTLDARRIYNDMGMESQDEIEEIMFEITGMLARNVWDKNFLSTATEFVESMGDGKDMFKFITSLPTRVIPNSINQTNPDPFKREARNFSDQWNSKLWSKSRALGQQYDKYGRARLKPENRNSMFNTRGIVENMVSKEELRLSELQGSDAIFGSPSTTLGTGKDDWRDIKDRNTEYSIYSKYMKILGQERNSKGLSLYEALEEAMESSRYLNLPDTIDESVVGPKVKLLKRIHNNFRELAIQELKEVSLKFRDKAEDIEYNKLQMWRQ